MQRMRHTGGETRARPAGETPALRKTASAQIHQIEHLFDASRTILSPSLQS
jgi:hypothetical protein